MDWKLARRYIYKEGKLLFLFSTYYYDFTEYNSFCAFEDIQKFVKKKEATER